MLPLSCFFVEDSNSKSSSCPWLTTTTRVSSGWAASISIRLVIRRSLREPMGLPPTCGGNAQASVTNRGEERPHTRRCRCGDAGAGIRPECDAGLGTHCTLPCPPTQGAPARYSGGDLPKGSGRWPIGGGHATRAAKIYLDRRQT